MNKKTQIIISIFLIFFASQNIIAATHYVSKTGDNVPPFTSLANAANDIQTAIDIAIVGDTVLVDNGVYDTGTRVTPGHVCLNRVVITNDIIVKSINGPDITIILGSGPKGYSAVRGVYMSAGILSGFTVSNGHTRQMTGDCNYDQCGGGVNMYGGNAVVTNCIISGNDTCYNRDSGGGVYGGTVNDCTISGNSAYMGGGTAESTVNNSIISNNSADMGGGIYNGTINNCIISNNSAYSFAGGICGGTVSNCTVIANSASVGGGVDGSKINKSIITNNFAYESGGGANHAAINYCIISGNSAKVREGGGVCGGTIDNSTISRNLAGQKGGGASSATINNCTITQNSAAWGGGTFGGTINNCIISGNHGGGTCNGIINNSTITMNSAGLGAGAFYGTVNNCIITKNSADTRGGGTCYAIVNNCTIIGNTAWNGSATAHSTVNNCIVWNNIAYNYGNNFCDSKIKYSCSAALSGEGNISNNPEFVDIKSGNYHLKVNSSCINAGTNAFAPMPYDLDGNSRVFDNIVDMGAYEYPVR